MTYTVFDRSQKINIQSQYLTLKEARNKAKELNYAEFKKQKAIHVKRTAFLPRYVPVRVAEEFLS